MAVEWKKVVLESSAGNVSQNAATATALAAAVGLQVDLTETDASNFDGSGAVTDIGVSGTLAVTNGGTGLNSVAQGSLIHTTSANTFEALSGGADDNGKVVAYNSTSDVFELVDAGTATNATNVAVTDVEEAAGNRFITFVSALTGNNPTQVESNLVYAANTNTITANLTGNVTGDVTGDLTGTASKVSVTDSSANTAFPVVFNNESDALLDDTGAFTYNPSTGTLTATAFAGNITGTLTGSADTVATSASSSSDAHFIAMFANASGDQAPVTDAGLKYTPSSDTLTVSNLTVSGTTTTVNTTDLEVTDKIIRVANNGTNAATVERAGMEIDTENSTQLPFIGFKDGAALTEMIVRKEGDTTNFPIAVMAHAAGAPGVASDAAGKGAFYYDTSNDALYLQVNT